MDVGEARSIRIFLDFGQTDSFTERSQAGSTGVRLNLKFLGAVSSEDLGANR
ncbi:hypothetical protein CKA32_001327 [Geitlerinema sp. FC II]|nr:hypothetical protein CKA32_001327 [Geitlerinema sp. FC II]